jgi:hypothetical protein
VHEGSIYVIQYIVANTKIQSYHLVREGRRKPDLGCGLLNFNEKCIIKACSFWKITKLPPSSNSTESKSLTNAWSQDTMCQNKAEESKSRDQGYGLL